MPSPVRVFVLAVCVAAISVPEGTALSDNSSRFSPGSDGAARRDFSKDELGRLDRGELVVRRAFSRRGGLKLIGGTSWQVIDASPCIVWQAVLDTDHYHRMLPQVMETRLVRKRGDRRTLYIRHGNKLINVGYHLNVNVYPHRKDITFSVDKSRPGTLKAGWGFYMIRPYGKDRSVLTYGIMADIGEGIIPALLRESVHKWMLKVPWMIKKFVEGSGRWIYK